MSSLEDRISKLEGEVDKSNLCKLMEATGWSFEDIVNESRTG
jgi:hypothetical protein